MEVSQEGSEVEDSNVFRKRLAGLLLKLMIRFVVLDSLCLFYVDFCLLYKMVCLAFGLISCY